MVRLFCLVSLILGGFVSAVNADGGIYVLKSGDLEVVVDSAFPRVVSYKHLESGAVINGQPGSASELKINGEIFTPEVESKGPGKIFKRHVARYKLEVEKDGAEVEVDVEISLKVPDLRNRCV